MKKILFLLLFTTTIINAQWVPNNAGAGSYDRMVKDSLSAKNVFVVNSDTYSSALEKYFEPRAEWYGVEWNWETDSYTRIGSTSEFDLGISPGNINLPIQSEMRRCVVNDSGQVQYYLNASNSYLTENGDSAKLDGTDGQVMVEIPQFYYQMEFLSNSVRIMVSKDSVSGWRKMEHRFIGAFPAVMYDASAGSYVVNGDSNMYAAGDKLASIVGYKPKTSETRAEFRAAAEERGSIWHQLGYEDYYAIQLMYVTEYADFNIQSAIGAGNTNFAAWDYDLDISETGKSLTDGNSTNNRSTAGGDSLDYISYRGIEDVFGNTWQSLDGANVNNDGISSKLWVNEDYTTWADDTELNYTYVGALAQKDGYISNIIRTNTLFAPSQVLGSSNTYLSDYYYTDYDDNSSVGWRVLLAGGLAYYGGPAGVFIVYSDRGSSLGASTIAARLCARGKSN